MPHHHHHHHDPNHQHDHDPGHADHHDHDHHHGHAHNRAPLSFSEKLTKLLDHWIQHNSHHAEDYRQWAQDARENNQAAVADLLEVAADLTNTISERFRDAGRSIKPD